MIVTVTPNPALDRTWTLPRMIPGESHRVETGHVRAGGKGLNVARVLHALGEQAHAVFPVGGAEGAQLTEDLRGAGVRITAVPVAAPTRTSVAIVSRDSGEATLLNERGGEMTAPEVRRLRAAVGAVLLGARGLVVSGSLPPGMEPATVAELVREAVAARIPVIVDCPGEALRAAAAAGADLVKPNLDELREATGIADPAEAAGALLSIGARMVAASLGEDGMLLARRADDGSVEAVRARLPRPLRGNATGAGDAAVAALAAALARGEAELTAMARVAVGVSAAAVLMPYAGEVSADHAALSATVVVEPARPTDREENLR